MVDGGEIATFYDMLNQKNIPSSSRWWGDSNFLRYAKPKNPSSSRWWGDNNYLRYAKPKKNIPFI